MEIRFDITKRFEADIASLDPVVKGRIEASIAKYARALEGGTGSQRPTAHVVKLRGGLHSSLYSLRVNPQFRIILTSDNDPIFRQTIVTLLRVVKHDETERALRSISESLYQDFLHREEP